MPTGVGSLSEDRSAKAKKKVKYFKKCSNILICSISFFTTVTLIHARPPRDKISSFSQPCGDASPPKHVACASLLHSAMAVVCYISDLHWVVTRWKINEARKCFYFTTKPS